MKNKKKSVELLSKRVLGKNKKAFEALEIYKKSTDILERVKIASGKSGSYVLANHSTIDIKLDTHGISTTQNI